MHNDSFSISPTARSSARPSRHGPPRIVHGTAGLAGRPARGGARLVGRDTGEPRRPGPGPGPPGDHAPEGLHRRPRRGAQHQRRRAGRRGERPRGRRGAAGRAPGPAGDRAGSTTRSPSSDGRSAPREEELARLDQLAELLERQFEATRAKAEAELTQAREDVRLALEQQDADVRLAEVELEVAKDEEAASQAARHAGRLAGGPDQGHAKAREAEGKLAKARLPVDESGCRSWSGRWSWSITITP